MLGLPDGGDPTPPIRSPGWVGLIVIAFGLFEGVYGGVRIGGDLATGILFLAGGVLFVVLGTGRVVSWRHARGSGGGSGRRRGPRASPPPG